MAKHDAAGRLVGGVQRQPAQAPFEARIGPVEAVEAAAVAVDTGQRRAGQRLGEEIEPGGAGTDGVDGRQLAGEATDQGRPVGRQGEVLGHAVAGGETRQAAQDAKGFSDNGDVVAQPQGLGHRHPGDMGG